MTLRYDAPARRCLGHCQDGLVILQDRIEAYWPEEFSLGCYACRGTATGGASCHAEGRATDVGLHFVGGKANALGNEISRWASANAAALDIQGIRWNHESWGFGTWHWRTSTSGDPHTSHVHIETNWDGARHLTRARIDAVRPHAPTQGPANPPTPFEEDDDMTMIHPRTGPDAVAIFLHGGDKLFVMTKSMFDSFAGSGHKVVELNEGDWNRLKSIYTVVP